MPKYVFSEDFPADFFRTGMTVSSFLSGMNVCKVFKPSWFGVSGMAYFQPDYRADTAVQVIRRVQDY